MDHRVPHGVGAEERHQDQSAHRVGEDEPDGHLVRVSVRVRIGVRVRVRVRVRVG